MSSAKCRPFCLGLNVLTSAAMWELFRIVSYNHFIFDKYLLCFIEIVYDNMTIYVYNA